MFLLNNGNNVMQKLIELPTYLTVEEVLEEVHSLITPAEVHGLLCAIICLGQHELDSEDWAAKAIGFPDKDIHLSKKQGKILQSLLDYSFNRLTAMEFDFQLLLPEDNTALDKRSMELGNWCHGFITGLELSDDIETINDRLSVDAYVAINRLAEIADIDYDLIEFDESDESAFFEVSEYVRMVVLMIFSEINQSASNTHAGSSTIH